MNHINGIKHDIKFYELDESFKRYLETDDEDLHVMQGLIIDKNIFKFSNIKEYYLVDKKIVRYIYNDLLNHYMYFWDGNNIIIIPLKEALDLPRID